MYITCIPRGFFGDSPRSGVCGRGLCCRQAPPSMNFGVGGCDGGRASRSRATRAPQRHARTPTIDAAPRRGAGSAVSTSCRRYNRRRWMGCVGWLTEDWAAVVRANDGPDRAGRRAYARGPAARREGNRAHEPEPDGRGGRRGWSRRRRRYRIPRARGRATTPKCGRWPRQDRPHGARRCTARSSRAAITGRTGAVRGADRRCGRGPGGGGHAGPEPRRRRQGHRVAPGPGDRGRRGPAGEREAARLNEAFVTWAAERRPFVTLKIAASLDGRIAARPGARTALTSPAANRIVHDLRAPGGRRRRGVRRPSWWTIPC